MNKIKYLKFKIKLGFFEKFLLSLQGKKDAETIESFEVKKEEKKLEYESQKIFISDFMSKEIDNFILNRNKMLSEINIILDCKNDIDKSYINCKKIGECDLKLCKKNFYSYNSIKGYLDKEISDLEAELDDILIKFSTKEEKLLEDIKTNNINEFFKKSSLDALMKLRENKSTNVIAKYRIIINYLNVKIKHMETVKDNIDMLYGEYALRLSHYWGYIIKIKKDLPKLHANKKILFEKKEDSLYGSTFNEEYNKTLECRDNYCTYIKNYNDLHIHKQKGEKYD